MITKAPIEKPTKWRDPGQVIDAPSWIEYYQRIYDHYDRVDKWVDPYWESFGKVAPTGTQLRDGLLAYANGTDWNPSGAGTKGYFRYNSTTSSWVFVG